MQPGTIQQAATQHNLTRGYLSKEASARTDFPKPIDTTRRPYLYDLDAITQWLNTRPGQGKRTDLHTNNQARVSSKQ